MTFGSPRPRSVEDREVACWSGNLITPRSFVLGRLQLLLEGSRLLERSARVGKNPIALSRPVAVAENVHRRRPA